MIMAGPAIGRRLAGHDENTGADDAADAEADRDWPPTTSASTRRFAIPPEWWSPTF